MKDIQREVQVLNLVGKQRNVAELIRTFEDGAYVHLVLELCKGGELFDRVVAKGTFTEKMAAGHFLRPSQRVLLPYSSLAQSSGIAASSAAQVGNCACRLL